MWGYCSGKNSDHHKAMENDQPEEQQHTVPAHQKEMLWAELKDMFTLPEGVNEELVKKCALKRWPLHLQLSRRSCSPITSRRIRS